MKHTFHDFKRYSAFTVTRKPESGGAKQPTGDWPTGTPAHGETPHDENGPRGNRFPHSEKMNKTFLQGKEIGKVIEEQACKK